MSAEWLQFSPAVVGFIVTLIGLGLLLMTLGAYNGARACFVIAAGFFAWAIARWIACDLKLSNETFRPVLVLGGIVVVGLCLVGVLAWCKKQEPNLSAEILSVFSIFNDPDTFLVIELTIANRGAATTVHGFRATLASNDGSEKVRGDSFRVDASFDVEGLDPGFGGRCRFLLDNWLEQTVGQRLVARGSTAMPGFFVARFKGTPFQTLRDGLKNCHLEVDLCDARGHRFSPALYSRTDKSGDLLIAFGSYAPIG